MKIAVPTKANDMVDEHFGHCSFYTIYDIENKKIVSKSTLQSPQGCGCKSNIASIFQKMGVKLMLAGNMGEGAVNVLKYCDIEVIRGCSGNTDDVVNAYLKGEIKDSGIGCAGHGSECHNN